MQPITGTNNMTVQPAPDRVRPARAEVEKETRRRRQDMGLGRMRTLDVVGDKDPNFEYRWVNDEPGRMYQLTQADDWDVVQQGELGKVHEKDKGVGTGIERVVDKRTGKRAVLLRKKKDYYIADKAKEQASIDETEQGIRQGATPASGGAPGEALSGPTAYVPAGGIVLRNGAKS
jgi:hypothetical protein